MCAWAWKEKSFECVGARWKIINNFYVEPFSLEPRFLQWKKKHVSSPTGIARCPRERFLMNLNQISAFLFLFGVMKGWKNWIKLRWKLGRVREIGAFALEGWWSRPETPFNFIFSSLASFLRFLKWIFYDLEVVFFSTRTHFQLYCFSSNEY